MVQKKFEKCLFCLGLTYWVVYSILNFVESVTDMFVFWIPFYYGSTTKKSILLTYFPVEIKLVALVLLQLPSLRVLSKNTNQIH